MRRQIEHRVAAQPGAEQDEAGSDGGQQFGQRSELREAVDVVAGDRGRRVEPLEHPLRHDPLSIDRRRKQAHEQHLAPVRLGSIVRTTGRPLLWQYSPGRSRFRYSPLIVHVRLTFTAGNYWRLNVRGKLWFLLRAVSSKAAMGKRHLIRTWSAERLGRPRSIRPAQPASAAAQR